MSKNVGRTLAGSSGAPRSNLDFYQTPEEDVKKFLRTSGLVPNAGLVLEPAAGDGNIVRCLKELRPEAKIVAGDIAQREFELDYVADFLTQPFKKEVDCIITNPPFTHALEFIVKSLEICKGDVIMLLKVAFVAGQKRRALFERGHLKSIYVSSSRINCYMPGVATSSTGRRTNSATLDMGWYVFNRNYKGEPVIKWL